MNKWKGPPMRISPDAVLGLAQAVTVDITPCLTVDVDIMAVNRLVRRIQ